MKKRIEISVDAIESTLDGVEMRFETNLAVKIFVRAGFPVASICGVPGVMAIRKACIQDHLDWLLIDFNEDDEIHRVAIRISNPD